MLLIYSSSDSNRLRYVLNLVFRDTLKLQYRLTTNLGEVNSGSFQAINYSNEAIPGLINIAPSGLLFEDKITAQKPQCFDWNGITVFYATNEDSELPFDPLSMIFFLVSRYEEYYFGTRLDKHHRFPAKASFAFKNGFLEKPLVNIIIAKLKELISNRYPMLKFTETKYQFTPTIDIDMAYAFKGKTIVRSFGGVIKQLLKFHFIGLIKRFKVYLKVKEDPFDNYDFIINETKHIKSNALFFVNLGDNGPYDKNSSYKNHRFRNLLVDINKECKVGIHPSYVSNRDSDILSKEIKRLNEILDEKVTISRQHFLRLELPQTYKNLIRQGIKEDYTLGYASLVGFRASICTPFKFYDLNNERESELTLYPFAFMDATFEEYMKLDDEEVLTKIKQISDDVRSVNGHLMGIWHNYILTDCSKRRALFSNSLKIAAE